MKLSNKILIIAIGLGVLSTIVLMVKVKMEADNFKSTRTIGNKTWVSIDKTLDEYNSIQVEGHFEVNWHKGSPMAKINIEENFKDYVKVEQEGNKVRVYLDSIKNYKSNGVMTIDLYSDAFDELVLMDFCEFTCEDKCIVPTLKVFTKNHSEAKINAEVDTLIFTAQDFSESKMSGTAQYSKMVMTDHSALKAYDFESNSAEVNLSNFSTAKITVKSSLSAHCSDHTDLRYRGDSLVTQIINREFSEVRKTE